MTMARLFMAFLPFCLRRSKPALPRVHCRSDNGHKRGYPPALYAKEYIVKYSTERARRYPTFTASSAVAGVASGLRILRGLGYAADSGRRYSASPTTARGRTHAVAGPVARRGRRWKLSCATHGQRAARRFNITGSRICLPHAADFLAPPTSADGHCCCEGAVW
jgi:hypothetical protein